MSIARQLLAAFALLCLVTSPALAQGPDSASMAQVATGSTQVSWNPGLDAAAYELTVVGPAGETFEQSFAGDGAFTFNLRHFEAPSDGSWTWEIRRVPRISDEVAQLLAEARAAGDDGIVHRLRAQGALPTGPFTQAGNFRVDGGAIVQTSDTVENPADGGASAPAPGGIENITAADQVFLDDLIVDGSACVGTDCVNGENFGFDTLRLKENNLRLHFDDTSSSGSFPSNDWRLIANDSNNGGDSYLAIEDATANRIPFRVEAGARANALVVHDTGRIGMGTSSPAVQMHNQDGNSPALRLHQDGSDGFQTQIWDIAGNETNFFVRDVTNASLLPFRIKPGAPTDSLFIAADGDIGIGTESPAEPFHVRRTDGTAGFLVEEDSTTTANRVLAEIRNNGPVTFQYTNTAGTGTNWQLNNLAGGFSISVAGSGSNEALFQTNGNLIIQGTLTENSDRNTKRFIEQVTPREVLDRLTEVPITTWNRKSDDPAIRHMGPMAQDFAAVFGLGINNTSISSLDMAGVSMAAVQGLYDVVEEDRQAKQAEIDRLGTVIDRFEAENQELRQRLERLETLLLEQE